MRTIAIANQKGGCGKTTTAINLSACLARKGRQVLLIDLDPQAHATMGLGVAVQDLKKGTYEVLMGSASVTDAAAPGSTGWEKVSSQRSAVPRPRLLNPIGLPLIVSFISGSFRPSPPKRRDRHRSMHRNARTSPGR